MSTSLAPSPVPSTKHMFSKCLLSKGVKTSIGFRILRGIEHSLQILGRRIRFTIYMFSEGRMKTKTLSSS